MQILAIQTHFERGMDFEISTEQKRNILLGHSNAKYIIFLFLSMEDFLNEISEEFIQERINRLKEKIQSEKKAIFGKVFAFRKQLFNSLNLKVTKKSESESLQNGDQTKNLSIPKRNSEEREVNCVIQCQQMNSNQIVGKYFDQKQAQNCFSLFQKACGTILNTYFPLLMDQEFLSLQSEDQIEEKLSYLNGVVEKTALNLIKKLTKPNQFLREAEKDSLANKEQRDIGDSSVEISCQNTNKTRKIKKEKATRSSPQRKRGKNTKIPNQSTYVMQKWLLQNFQDPYPSLAQKNQMAIESGLTVYQVNNWFINARERVIKKYLKKDGVSNHQTNKNRKFSQDEEYIEVKKSRRSSRRQNNSRSQISEGSGRLSNLSQEKEELMEDS